MSLKSILKKAIFPVLTVMLFASSANAAAPDGSDPWADSVVLPSSQGLTNENQPVSVTRSDASQALGIAEDTDVDGTFYSLGFGGSITLRFDNGIANGVFVVESTRTEPGYPFYPEETAQVEISEDGSPGSWYFAGNVSQDEAVSQPQEVSCAQYVRITDTSVLGNFADYPGADGYDVDGVEAQEGEPCDPPVSPTPTPTSPPSSPPGPAGPPVCSAQTPTTPTLSSVTRTSPTTAELVWTAASPVTHYSISYGTSPGNYQFGAPNVGNTTSYVVGGLDPNTNYYFVVTAVNDCAPSSASNELSTGGAVLGAATGGVLGASTDTLAATGDDYLILRLLFASSAFLATFLLGRRFLPKNGRK